jgi:redox-sensitive bicupin YhaK (pirin superfamily)
LQDRPDVPRKETGARPAEDKAMDKITKDIAKVRRPHGGHWVGDGCPVRTLFSYDEDASAVSPFLLFDYAGPHMFAPSPVPRGVGQHPHRGFETVTIVYDGEVAHRDSTGQGGVIGPGDVQWMTAAGGILHEEFHSPAFTKTGGSFRMVQLWVNLPASAKMSTPRYQPIGDAEIPAVELNGGAGRLRVIAGQYGDAEGPATTFTPINLWDVRLTRGADLPLDLPEGHNTMIAVLDGHVTINGEQTVKEAEIVCFERSGTRVQIHAGAESILLVLTGEPIDEPVAGYGPFVMNSQAEIRQAIDDVNSGRFGRISRA